MMVIRWSGVLSAGLALMLGAMQMQAQTVAQVGSPAELPPQGFTGQQYVDSRGCVFMRAGFSGRTVWVPRIGRDRNAICSAVTPAEAAARLNAPKDNSDGILLTKPLDTVASSMGAGQNTGVFAPAEVPGLTAQSNQTLRTAPRASAMAVQPIWGKPFHPQPKAMYPAQSAAAVFAPNTATMAPSLMQGAANRCPKEAPVLGYVALNTGGSMAVCTRGDGSSNGWFAPSSHGYVPNAARPAGQAVASGYAGQQPSARQTNAVPAGYDAAWNDGRLNPRRGMGTAQGWADQSEVWANTVPANTHEQIAAQKARRSKGLGIGDSAVQMTEVSYTPPVTADMGHWSMGGGHIYVQVGSFANPANAQNTAGRLTVMGLPVALAQSTKRGRALTSVMAGPFASQAEARQALSMARSAGFSDAFIR
jgi:cell division septation protein DedD